MKKMRLIFKDGKVIKQTEGFTGQDCVTKTKFIEDALHGRGKKEFTEEYYATGNANEGEKITA